MPRQDTTVEDVCQALIGSSSTSAPTPIPVPPSQDRPVESFSRSRYSQKGIEGSKAEVATPGIGDVDRGDRSTSQSAQPIAMERMTPQDAEIAMRDRWSFQRMEPAVSDSFTARSWDRAVSESPTFSSASETRLADADAVHARVAAKLLSKGMDLGEVADTLDLEVTEVRMLISQARLVGG